MQRSSVSVGVAWGLIVFLQWLESCCRLYHCKVCEGRGGMGEGEGEGDPVSVFGQRSFSDKRIEDLELTLGYTALHCTALYI